MQVPGDERAKLVQELLQLIEGKVMAIVMKHDASRVVQTALQFGNREVFLYFTPGRACMWSVVGAG